MTVAACGGPVEWKEERAYAASAAITLTPEGDTVTDSLTLLARTLVPPSNSCPGSLRVSRLGTLIVAVWWAPRPDSGARLLFARSADAGKTWTSPSPVDSLDRGVSGCRRDAAAIAVDSSSGYVHVAYGLMAPEGAGIFFAHSMDSGTTFHSPVAIVYGDHPGSVSVAARGDVVAVAYDDPNGTAERVGLALSRTMGHIFEDRILPVSDDNSAATRPIVSVRGRRITVGWREGARTRGDSILRVRVGLIF